MWLHVSLLQNMVIQVCKVNHFKSKQSDSTCDMEDGNCHVSDKTGWNRSGRKRNRLQQKMLFRRGSCKVRGIHEACINIMWKMIYVNILLNKRIFIHRNKYIKNLRWTKWRGEVGIKTCFPPTSMEWSCFLEFCSCKALFKSDYFCSK